MNNGLSIIPNLVDGESPVDSSRDKATLLSQCPPLSYKHSGNPESDEELDPLEFPDNLLCSEDTVTDLVIYLYGFIQVFWCGWDFKSLNSLYQEHMKGRSVQLEFIET